MKLSELELGWTIRLRDPDTDDTNVGTIIYLEEDWVGLIMDEYSPMPFYAEIYEDDFEDCFIERILL